MSEKVRADITEALHRYCRGIDRMDADLIRSAYHSDGYDDHGDVFRGSVEDYITWVLNVLAERFDSTMHTLTNITIEQDGGVAHVESYLIAYHVTKGGGSLKVFGARYVDRFEDRPGAGWRIAHRTLVSEWQTEQTGFVATPPGTAPAARDRTDPSYRRD
ncbi:nuclear transport factor 2 family protein [Sporichthya brevicatena]|uniref:Nuclear transport factor 2 family protein n=1 Tax=Sporichthya brevicatena TaxID=171442 RepID=A0ABN1GDM5_9ACTN